MSLPPRFAPDDPREWLNRARSNLARAQTRAPGVYLEDLCFDAQQAAEKAIKAVLIERVVAFPYIHDLSKLLALLQQAGQAIPGPVREADRLTRFAFAGRYPSALDPVTEDEHREYVAIAETVVRWAEDLLGYRP